MIKNGFASFVFVISSANIYVTSPGSLQNGQLSVFLQNQLGLFISLNLFFKINSILISLTFLKIFLFILSVNIFSRKP